jgi:hypothetical protein
MNAELKSVLLELVDEAELLRAHSIVQSSALERAGIGVNRDAIQAEMSLAKKANAKKYSSLRSKIEALK